MSGDKAKNLWILTEERPKLEVLRCIIEKFATDNHYAVFIDKIRILPILEDGRFTFVYEVAGYQCNRINKIFLCSISGYSSFVDYLVFYQNNMPDPSADVPYYAIEETKTDDGESRNTGVYQRCSKFVYIESYFPNTQKVMLYNIKIDKKEIPTETNVFGTRMMLTAGIEILGKTLDAKIFRPFQSIEELIECKNSMRKPPAGNVPIEIKKVDNKIYISGRLFKSGGLSHDPNIGALTMIAATLRKLGWDKDIVITHHGLSQKHLHADNKFVIIANEIGINLEGLEMPEAKRYEKYWYYDNRGEKIGTIFTHLLIENFTEGYSIYENHAGCERGYFLTANGEHISIDKYTNREEYKSGDKSKIINLPDLTILDARRKQIVNIEGEMYKNKNDGIRQLSLFDAFEELYINKYYADFTIVRTVILYGGSDVNEKFEAEVGFALSKHGDLMLGIKAPEIFKDAIIRLIDFWS